MKIDSIEFILPDERDIERFFQASRFDEQFKFAWKYPSVRFQKTFLQVQDILNHVFIEQVVAYLFMNDHIELDVGSKVTAVGLNELYILKIVVFRHLSGDFYEI